jgi:hypothetical protein
MVIATHVEGIQKTHLATGLHLVCHYYCAIISGVYWLGDHLRKVLVSLFNDRSILLGYSPFCHRKP